MIQLPTPGRKKRISAVSAASMPLVLALEVKVISEQEMMEMTWKKISGNTTLLQTPGSKKRISVAAPAILLHVSAQVVKDMLERDLVMVFSIKIYGNIPRAVVRSLLIWRLQKFQIPVQG